MMAVNLGQPLPEELQACPELNDFEYMLLECYTELQSERPSSMDYAHIPRSSVIDLANYYNFDEEDTWYLLQVISKIDAAMIEDARVKNG